jgi:hypothetical protein
MPVVTKIIGYRRFQVIVYLDNNYLFRPIDDTMGLYVGVQPTSSMHCG